MSRIAAFRAVVLLIALPAFGPEPAQAWGVTAHRVIGEIAQAHLGENARREIEAILGAEDLAEASTWADFMRSSDAPFWRRSGPLHYVTIPPGRRYADVGAPDAGDAITALTSFRNTLRDPAATATERRLALRFLVHLVGDLHQPFHAGNGRDRGGNDFDVTFFGRRTNLHALWDTALVTHEKLAYTEMARWLDRSITPTQAAAWRVTDPVVWAEESAAVRDGLYPRGDRDLGYDYVFTHRATLRRRLAQGGIRLAAYLDAVFGDPPAGR